MFAHLNDYPNVNIRFDLAEFNRLRLATINAYNVACQTLDQIGRIQGYESDEYTAFMSVVDGYQDMRDTFESVRYEIGNRE